MITARRRLLLPLVLMVLLSILFFYPWIWDHRFHVLIPASHKYIPPAITDPKVLDDPDYFWRRLPTHYPVDSFRPLPTQQPLALPKIQADFPKESSQDRQVRLQRQAAVQRTFERSWSAYKKLALPDDELAPLSGGSKNTFGGWGATLVDSLDTLWIMGLREEFDEAVVAAVDIDFETSSLQQIK